MEEKTNKVKEFVSNHKGFIIGTTITVAAVLGGIIVRNKVYALRIPKHTYSYDNITLGDCGKIGEIIIANGNGTPETKVLTWDLLTMN